MNTYNLVRMGTDRFQEDGSDRLSNILLLYQTGLSAYYRQPCYC
jgi:hypothetical protein